MEFFFQGQNIVLGFLIMILISKDQMIYFQKKKKTTLISGY